MPGRKGPAVLQRAARRAILGAALACAACSSPYEPPVHADPAHAIATIYVREPLARGFRLEGTASLPRMPFNRSWYGDWFTFTAKPTKAVPNPPFVQAGLIRSQDGDFALRSFVALRPTGKSVALHELGELNEGPHRIALESKDGVLSFDVDGVTMYQLAARDLVDPGATSTYLQIGHELSEQDDFAKGSIRGIAFSSGAKPRLRPLEVALDCYYSSNGVRWQPLGSSVVATGKFDAAVADETDCTP